MERGVSFIEGIDCYDIIEWAELNLPWKEFKNYFQAVEWEPLYKTGVEGMMKIVYQGEKMRVIAQMIWDVHKEEIKQDLAKRALEAL